MVPRLEGFPAPGGNRMSSKSLRSTLLVPALAFVFTTGLAVLAVEAGDHGKDGKAATCPHAAAAVAADGEVAAPCDHGANGKCASCADAKDCPMAKGEACAECGAKDKAPEAH
jgi:hypothetical protein